MNKIFYLSILVVLSSCVNVYFSDLQPKGGKEKFAVPTELHGMWTRNLDTTWINSSGMIQQFESEDSLGNQTFSSSYFLLNDSLKLVSSHDLYVAHLKFKDTEWMIYVIEKDKSGEIVFYSPMNEPYFKESKNFKITEIKRKPIDNFKYNEETLEYEEDTINIIDEDKRKIESILYSGQMPYKELKTVIRKENILYIFHPNGTFEERNVKE